MALVAAPGCTARGVRPTAGSTRKGRLIRPSGQLEGYQLAETAHKAKGRRLGCPRSEDRWTSMKAELLQALSRLRAT